MSRDLLHYCTLGCYFIAAGLLLSGTNGKRYMNPSREELLDIVVTSSNLSIITSHLALGQKSSGVTIVLTDFRTKTTTQDTFPGNQGVYIVPVKPNHLYGLTFTTGKHKEYRLLTTPPESGLKSGNIQLPPRLATLHTELTDQHLTLKWVTKATKSYSIDAQAIVFCNEGNVTQREKFTAKVPNGAFEIPLKEASLTITETTPQESKYAFVKLTAEFEDCNKLCWNYWVLMDTGEAFQMDQTCQKLLLDDVGGAIPLVENILVHARWIALTMPREDPEAKYVQKYQIKKNTPAQVQIAAFDITRREEVPAVHFHSLQPSYSIHSLEPDTWYELKIITSLANITKYAYEQSLIAKTLPEDWNGTPQIYPPPQKISSRKSEINANSMQGLNTSIMDFERTSKYELIQLISLSHADILLVQCTACRILRNLEIRVDQGCSLSGTIIQLSDEEPILVLQALSNESPRSPAEASAVNYTFEDAGESSIIIETTRNFSIESTCQQVCFTYSTQVHEDWRNIAAQKTKIGYECFALENFFNNRNLPPQKDNKARKIDPLTTLWFTLLILTKRIVTARNV